MDLTYYDVLGVDDDANQEEIKRAFRQASKKFHPDAPEGNSRQFRAIKIAYDVLGDSERRAAYDNQLKLGAQPRPEPESPSWGGEADWGSEVDWGSESTWEDGTIGDEAWPPSPREDLAPPLAEWPPSPITSPAAAERGETQEASHQQRQPPTEIQLQKLVRRRSHDLAVLVLSSLLCVTILVPWTIGRYLVRDNVLHPRSAAVYDRSLRTAGRYFSADWSAGSVWILAGAVVFVLIRPWRGRLGTVITAALLGVALLAGAVPYSRAQWSRAEALTGSQLRNSVYPFASHYLTCGQASRSFGSSPVEPGKPEVTYTLYSAHYANNNKTTCDGLELWEGWHRLKQIPLAKGQTIKPGDRGVSVTGKPTVESTVFTVRLASGKTARYPLAQLLT